MAQFEIIFDGADCISYTVSPTSVGCELTYRNCSTGDRINKSIEVPITICAQTDSVFISEGTATVVENESC